MEALLANRDLDKSKTRNEKPQTTVNQGTFPQGPFPQGTFAQGPSNRVFQGEDNFEGRHNAPSHHGHSTNPHRSNPTIINEEEFYAYQHQ
ncbi:hypothetical protein, partial [Escherichia coli]|uniref:hypothetical protein n=1 Tax=Escherichia coli TaxID=562 RepID=UPI003F44C7FD